MVRANYLFEKFGWEGDYLPLPYKVLKGDASDKIPSLIPRLRSDKVLGICRRWVHRGDDIVDVAGILQVLLTEEWSGAFAWVKDALRDVDSELYRGLDRNFKVVCPQYVPWQTLPLKNLGYGKDTVNNLLQNYYGFSAEDFYLHV